MTAKDYIYLALLFFSAIVFYLNGYYTGVNRSRRLFERVFNDQPASSANDIDLALPESDSRLRVTDPLECRGAEKMIASGAIRAVFGKN